MIGGFTSWKGVGIFLLTTESRLALGPTQLPIQWVPGTLSLGVKQWGHEAHHSTPSSAKVKNVWSYTSTPQYAFMAWSSVKKRTGTTLPLPYLPLNMVMYTCLLYFKTRLKRCMLVIRIQVRLCCLKWYVTKLPKTVPCTPKCTWWEGEHTALWTCRLQDPPVTRWCCNPRFISQICNTLKVSNSFSYPPFTFFFT
jgi:hypothetical protein